MSKTTNIILCVVYSALLSCMGWLIVKASQLPTPEPPEVAKLATARPVKTVIFHMPQEEAFDRTVICGGGDDKPRGPTELAGEPVHRCEIT